MNIHFTSYFDVHQGYKVLTHCQVILNRDNLTPAIKHLNGTCLFIDDFPIETSFYRGLFHCHV